MQDVSLKEMVSEQDPEQLFDLLDLLGEGSYGSVYKAVHKFTEQIYAIKIVSVIGEAESLKREISILKDCNSPFIVKYYGAYTKSNQLWLVMEYCAAGSAIDLIRITKRTLNEFEIASIAYNTLKGLAYLHDSKKIHRDIKGGNILLDHKGNSKLTDFGVSAQLMNTLADKDSVIGTPFWMSPEVISRSKYNKKTDIWSLGITCIELAEGEPPFSHIHPVRAMFVIKNNPPQGLTNPEQSSTEFKDFIKKCLTIEPDDRPGANELLQHPFMKKAKGRYVLSELVSDSLPQIERHRVVETRKYRNQVETLKDEDYGSVVIKGEQHCQPNETGTIIEYKSFNQNTQAYNFETMIDKGDVRGQFQDNPIESKNDFSDLQHYVLYGLKKNDQNTIVVKKDIEQPKNCDFVEYAKRMDGNFDGNSNYIKSHFSNNKGKMIELDLAYDSIEGMCPEFKQMNIEQLQIKLKKLKSDLLQEIQVIQGRYNKRIDEQLFDFRCENAIKLKQKEKTSQPQPSPNKVIQQNYNQLQQFNQNQIKNIKINNNFNINIEPSDNNIQNNINIISHSNSQLNIQQPKNQASYFLNKDYVKSEYSSQAQSRVDNTRSKQDISSQLSKQDIQQSETSKFKEILNRNKKEEPKKVTQLKIQIQRQNPQVEKKEVPVKRIAQNMPIHLAPKPNFLEIKKPVSKIQNEKKVIETKKKPMPKTPVHKAPLTPTNPKQIKDLLNHQDQNVYTFNMMQNFKSETAPKEKSNLLFGQFAQQYNDPKKQKDKPLNLILGNGKKFQK